MGTSSIQLYVRFFAFLLFSLFSSLGSFLAQSVNVRYLCQFLSPYSASCRAGNSSPLGPSAIRKRLFWHSSTERWLSFWDAQCFSQAQPPPERLQGEDGRNPQKCVWAHLTLSFDLRSVELVKTTMNSWNFQTLESPDGLKLSLKRSYFTVCVFP